MAVAERVTSEARVTFKRRATPLPPELRTTWRVATVLVLMRTGGKGATGRTSLRKLHVLSWGCRSPETLATLSALLHRPTAYVGPFPSVDPALSAAVDYAVGEALVQRLPNGRLCLTDLGRGVADDILANDLLTFEAECAREIKPLATEDNIAALLRTATRSSS